MRRTRSRAAILSVLLVAVLIFMSVYYVWNAVVDVFQPANPNGPGQSISVTISKGETTAQIADDLQSKGLIRNAVAFRIWARIRGLDKYLQAGVYKKLNTSMTISDIIDQLQNAQPDAANVLIKEGWRLEQIAQAFANASPKLTNFNKNDFLRFTQNVDQFPDAGQEPILKQLPDGQKNMEGLLFPATYEIPVDANATYVIDLMLKTMNDTIQQNKLDQLAQQHQLSIYQMITLASIVEREARGNQDRANIASVYWNRLYTDHGRNEARGFLQADPTVQYARDTQNPPAQVADYWKPLNDSPTNIAAASAWNTYTQTGLPPSPICSPGLASLMDSANPPQTQYVYFFAGNDGVTHFATSNTDFEQQKQQYGVNN